MKQQLKDKEKRSFLRRNNGGYDENGEEIKLPDDEEHDLMVQFEELMDYIRENRNTITYVAAEEKQKTKDADENMKSNIDFGEKDSQADDNSRTQRMVTKMLKSQIQQEHGFAEKSADAIRK